jgi:hypothetical protein
MKRGSQLRKLIIGGLSAMALAGGAYLLPAAAQDSSATGVDLTCPSAQELSASYDATGVEPKLPIDCDDPDPQGVPATDPVSVPEMPSDWADAQARLDPENDPDVVIGRQANGDFFVVHLATTVPVPDWVKTVADASKWSDSLSAERAR